MAPRAVQRTHLLAAIVFVAGILVLSVQLITPTPVMVSVAENGTEATQIGQYFTYRDVAVIAGSAMLCGVSGTYLLLEVPTSADWSAPATAETTASAETTAAVETSGVGAGTEQRTPDAHRDRWEETIERLENNEETLYSILVDADGELPQRELVAETDLSKATVSRTLDSLENRNLVERKRRGMGNVVYLQ